MTSNNGSSSGHSSSQAPKEDDKTAAYKIAISSSDLFTLNQRNQFRPGWAFFFVKALDTVNAQLKKLEPGSKELIHVVVLTNSTDTNLNDSIKNYNLSVVHSLITKGNGLIDCLRKNHIDLYLSADAAGVKEAMSEGIAAATMFIPEKPTEVSATQLRVAFDGDAVLFSDESEQVFKKNGLQQFLDNEKTNVQSPLNHGPLMGFLEHLWKLQMKFYSKGRYRDCPIRTYLVTSRDAGNAGFRALNTLKSRSQEMDEAFFLSGAPKGPMLERIRPHIFFDDQMSHVDSAVSFGTVAAHVPYDQWPKKE